MREFKGTKGKWEVLEYDSDLEVGNMQSSLICSLPDKNEEYYANALLISKAPEMLDFINRISGEMLRSDFVLDEKWYEQAQQLIREATKI